jgi:hypothetical protein
MSTINVSGKLLNAGACHVELSLIQYKNDTIAKEYTAGFEDSFQVDPGICSIVIDGLTNGDLEFTISGDDVVSVDPPTPILYHQTIHGSLDITTK